MPSRARAFAQAAVAALSAAGAAGAGDNYDPQADPAAMVVVGNARFTILTPRLIRMEWSPDGVFEDRASFAFVNRRLPVPAASVTRDGNKVRITTEAIELSYHDDGKPFNPTNLSVVLENRPNGALLWVWAPGACGPENLGGTTRTLDGVSGACELEDGLLSRRGYMVIDDSERLLFGRYGWATPRRHQIAAATVDAEPDAPTVKPIDLYFFKYGTDYKAALKDFAAVAGRIPLPPRYVFGAWWSRYWAYSDAELRELVEDFDKHDVPLDVLVVDMDWHLDGWTGYTWNPKYFPDPDGFLKWCTERGLRVTLNLHPAEGVGKQEQQFPKFCEAMGLDPTKTERVPFDCADPRYVAAYFKLLHHPEEARGVDFWWIDWQQGQQTKIAGLDPLFWLNHLHFKDMADRAEQTGLRPLIFSRWGGLGNHRYQIGFSGDTFCDWRSLTFQPYFTSTAGNVGYGFWSHDIGGHQPGKVDPELYARWIQWGALSPCLRTHTTKNPEAERRIWKFPPEVFEASRAAFQLRYELLPYIYTMARKTYDEALPLCRPLYYHWPEEDEAYKRPGEYMFGDDLLVAPVTKPVNSQTRCATVEVWFPPGGWTDWFTGRWYVGPRVETLSVPLDEIPLFVRDGAIIPTQERMERSDEKPLDRLGLHIFGGAQGQTTLYEDDGVSEEHRRGRLARTAVSFDRHGEFVDVTITGRDGQFAGMPLTRSYEIHMHNVPPPPLANKLDADTAALAATEQYSWSYAPDSATLSLSLGAKEGARTRTARAHLTPVRHTADFLARGLRGQLGVMSQVRDRLGERTPAGLVRLLEIGARMMAQPGECDRMLADALSDFQGVVSAVLTADLVPEERGWFLTRLLGVAFDLRVGELSADGAGLSAVATLRVDPPLGPIGGLSTELQLRSGDPDPRASTLAGRSDGELLRTEIALKTGNSLRSHPVSASATLKLGAAQAVLTIEKTLLPSINAWWVAGPFDANFETGLATVLPPESGFEPTATYLGKGGKQIGWKRNVREVRPGDDLTDEFFVHLHNFFGGKISNAVAYGFTYLHAPRDLDASLAIGSDDGVAVWLNGAEVHRKNIGRPYSPKQDRVAVKLRAGANELLVKVNQGGGDWGFSAFVETPDGRALPEVIASLEPGRP